MPLAVTPPLAAGSLWQAVCRGHGLLIHAAPWRQALMLARLHEFEHHERCTINVGGLRCMFCCVVVDLDRWPANVPTACEHCWSAALHDELPSGSVPHPVSHFPWVDIEPGELIAPCVVETAS